MTPSRVFDGPQSRVPLWKGTRNIQKMGLGDPGPVLPFPYQMWWSPGPSSMKSLQRNLSVQAPSRGLFWTAVSGPQSGDVFSRSPILPINPQEPSSVAMASNARMCRNNTLQAVTMCVDFRVPKHRQLPQHDNQTRGGAAVKTW